MKRLETVHRFFLALGSTTMLLIAGVSVPAAGILFIPLVPQPVLLFGLRYGRRWGALVLLGAIVLLFTLFGIDYVLIYGLFALMVVTLLITLARNWRIEAIVACCTSVVFAAASGMLYFSYGSWERMVVEIRTSLESNLSLSLRLQEKFGFAQDHVAFLKQQMPLIVDTIVAIAPALSFIVIGLIILFNVAFVRRRFPGGAEVVLCPENLQEWKGPELLVWGVIIGGFALFLPLPELFRVASMNLLLILAVFYFFQGLAVLAYYFQKKKVPFFLRSLTYVLIVFEQVFTLLIVGLGLFDLWGDFRRLNNKDLKPSRAS